MWPDTRLLELLGIELPIIQAPMAGSNGAELVIAVSEAGGLGSLPCAMLTPETARAQLGVIRQRTAKPINLNFFCHEPPKSDPQREQLWKERLSGYYRELGLDPAAPVAAASRAPFDEAMCGIVEEFEPEVVSFHFGLPKPPLVERVRVAGAKILSSATTPIEARWLEDNGCDAIIAQGFEAGGHRGMFLTADIGAQIGTMALTPLIVDAVKVPVIASGGISDARGVAAAFHLGAAAVQIGTAYLFTPEATLSAIHRGVLREARSRESTLTNLFSGRPARGFYNRLMRDLGPISDLAPQFPNASGALAPLRAAAEKAGSGDFSPLWTGQAAALAREESAGALTTRLAKEALQRLAGQRAV
ncbi:nitronate monooxygenase [Terrarubrum flagellatum]|uniref:NAD(P)H-dependent flavin oxidoreductase n=1 Tax=Terrirubrum flagellatum TaxID=2895980 RepID=UPI0031455656